MKFEVVNKLGQTVMSTEYESCVYDQEDLTAMHRAGYRFKVDGKFVNLGKVLPTVRESSKNSPAPTPTQSVLPEDWDPSWQYSAQCAKDVGNDNTEKIKRSMKSANIDKKKVENSVEKVENSVEKVENCTSIGSTSRSAAGKTTSTKKVVIRCKETGQTWEKQSWAAKELGIDAAQVSDSIKTGRTRSGYTFEKVEVDA